MWCGWDLRFICCKSKRWDSGNPSSSLWLRKKFLPLPSFCFLRLEPPSELRKFEAKKNRDGPATPSFPTQSGTCGVAAPSPGDQMAIFTSMMTSDESNSNNKVKTETNTVSYTRTKNYHESLRKLKKGFPFNYALFLLLPFFFGGVCLFFSVAFLSPSPTWAKSLKPTSSRWAATSHKWSCNHPKMAL